MYSNKLSKWWFQFTEIKKLIPCAFLKCTTAVLCTGELVGAQVFVNIRAHRDT